MKRLHLTFIMLMLGVESSALAVQYSRCPNDPGYPDQARRRVEWALKCGYIDHDDADYYNRKGLYPSYANQNMYLFFDSNAQCFSGEAVQEKICKAAGCYFRDQKLLFGKTYLNFDEASQVEKLKITSLKDNIRCSDFGHCLVEEEVDFLLSGETSEPMIKISTQTKELKVTPNHPMILASGQIVNAEKLLAGESLLMTVDGPELVTELMMTECRGLVWNVQVVSERQGANIHVAEGFLTGGLRFQNEWKDTEEREIRRLNRPW